MLLRKICLLILLLPLSLAPSISQQVYTSQDYGGPGTIYLYNQILGIIPLQEITQDGPDLLWDLSALTALNTHSASIITPSEGMDQVTFLTICALSGTNPFLCFAIWNQTDQALLRNDSLSLAGISLLDLQRYQNKTPNLLLENFFAFTVGVGATPTQAAIVYQQPDTIYKFPIAYSSTWTSSIDWFIDLSITGQNLIYKTYQTRNSQVSAWGTVFTPFDTFTNVIRLKSVIEHHDTLFADSLILPLMFTQIEYMWFDTNYKLPIMIANGIKTDTVEIINSIEYIYEATCPAPTWTADATSDFYYLNSSGAATVDFEITDDNAGTYTWDFGDGNTAISEGTISHAYTSAGYYSVMVTGCMTDCLPLNSCSSQLIEFEVIDTIFESTPSVPNDSQVIRVFPNPAKDYLNVHLAYPSTRHYEVLGVTGQKILEGILLPGQTGISLNSIPTGIYLIRLYEWNGTSIFFYSTKFLKTR